MFLPKIEPDENSSQKYFSSQLQQKGCFEASSIAMVYDPKITDSIGERLRAHRTKLNLSIKDVAHELRTSQKFISALEENRFQVFSAKVYAKGFLEKLIIFFTQKSETRDFDYSRIFKEFDAEWEVFMQKKKRAVDGKDYLRAGTLLITPRRIAISFTVILFLLFGGFLAVRITGFMRAPKLRITLPAKEGTIQEGPVLAIRGNGERESRLTVNGREIRMDESGNFDEEIELLAGRNILEFLLQNRFGKITKETRYVVVK